MQEKVLDNKKNGMGMMVLFILLYVAAAPLLQSVPCFTGFH